MVEPAGDSCHGRGMTTEFLGPYPWATIARKMYGQRPRRCAIAFIGQQAPELLRHLTDGDLLVVNASKEAVASHATSPDALAALIDAGVEVKSSPKLHAKVLVGASIAIVGSANASKNSTESQEAVIISHDDEVVRAAQNFVEKVAKDANPVDDQLLTELRRVWLENRRSPIPGVTGRSAETGLLSHWPTRVVLCPVEDDDLTDDEREAMTAAIEHQTPKYPIFGYQLDDNDDEGYGEGTVLLRYDQEQAWFYEPAVVYGSYETPIPGRTTGAYQLIRHKRGQQGRALDPLLRRIGPQHAKELKAAIVATGRGDATLPHHLAKAILNDIWRIDIDDTGQRKS